MSSGNSRPGASLIFALVLLGLGVVACSVSVGALWSGERSRPDIFTIFLVFLPYLAGGLILQITRAARVTIWLVTLAAFVDLWFAILFTAGEAPTWDSELAWRLMRLVVSLLSITIFLAIALIIERQTRE